VFRIKVECLRVIDTASVTTSYLLSYLFPYRYKYYIISSVSESESFAHRAAFYTTMSSAPFSSKPKLINLCCTGMLSSVLYYLQTNTYHTIEILKQEIFEQHNMIFFYGTLAISKIILQQKHQKSQPKITNNDNQSSALSTVDNSIIYLQVLRYVPQCFHILT
jgi:hypothetical protein